MKKEIVYDFNDPSWIKNINNCRPSNKKVVLTFDDGPGRYTNDLLDILKTHQVKAMFFWQSKLLHHKRPWKRVLEEGHIIGTHAHNHKNLTTLSNSEQFQYIKMSKDLIEETIGEEIHYFRPPFGQYNEETLKILKKLQLTPIMWEISSYDWELKTNPKQIIENVVDHVQDGSIILLHELEQTVLALPSIITKIRENGFEFDIL